MAYQNLTYPPRKGSLVINVQHRPQVSQVSLLSVSRYTSISMVFSCSCLTDACLGSLKEGGGERPCLFNARRPYLLNEPTFSNNILKFQIFGTCTQAFLQMFSENLERSRARKNFTCSFQILEPISTFPKYPCEGRHG